MRKLAFALTLATLSCAAVATDTQQLTEAQTEVAFAKADTDKNGTVSMAEAKKFGISDKAFAVANPDKDGTLDKKEFAAALSYQFNQANPDKDGTLDWKEAHKAGVKSKKTFEAANPDKDGTLDPVEYVNALVLQAK
jgi:hypothetical protein